jgi:hypothetical protein
MFINPDTAGIQLMSQRQIATGPRSDNDVLNLASKPSQDGAKTDQSGVHAQARAVDETMKIMAPVPTVPGERVDQPSIIPSHTMLAIIEARERVSDQTSEIEDIAADIAEDATVAEDAKEARDFTTLEGPNAPALDAPDTRAEPSEPEPVKRDTSEPERDQEQPEQRKLEQSVEALRDQQPPQVDVRS